MGSVFKKTFYSRLKDRVRASSANRLIRPTRLFLWECEDFVLDRLALTRPGLSRKLLVASMPKAGVHLLQEVLQGIPELSRRPMPLPNWEPVEKHRRSLKRLARNRFARWHFAARPETLSVARELNLGVLIIQRDPRDVVVSFVDHACNSPEHPFHSIFLEMPTRRERVMAVIRGISAERVAAEPLLAGLLAHNRVYPGLVDIGELCRAFGVWRKHPNTHFVRFEDLIGKQGGGNDEKQRTTIEGILSFLGLEARPELVEALCRRAYNPDSVTFNQGRCGRWREIFDGELSEEFRKTALEELVQMGYEKDARW